MNNKIAQSPFELCMEMLSTPDLIRNFNPEKTESLSRLMSDASGMLLTGEGSSRIFPAKRARAEALIEGDTLIPAVEGTTQALEYKLSSCGLLGASNSGRTRELVRLFTGLKEQGHKRLGGISAHSGTPLEALCNSYLTLDCGAEKAVAATMSVVEQAMVWQAVCGSLAGRPFPSLNEGAEAMEQTFQQSIPEEFIRSILAARTIYFAGRNNGVAEELTLKTNEIIRKPSAWLEGTYAVHGIEEVMNETDFIVVVDPFPEEESKFLSCLGTGASATIIAIAPRPTVFPTLRIPDCPPWNDYLLLAAGWKLLAESGIASGLNLDKTERARKIGNEVS